MNSFFHDALRISLRDEPIVHRTSCSNDRTTDIRRIRKRFFGQPIKLKLKEKCRSTRKTRKSTKQIRTNVSISSPIVRPNFRLQIEKICPIEREKCRFYQIENSRWISSRTRFGRAILFLQKRRNSTSIRFPIEFLLANVSSLKCRSI